MKISRELLKTIELVIDAKNAEVKARAQQETEKNVEHAKRGVQHLTKELAIIHAKELAITEQLNKAGFTYDGSPGHQMMNKLKVHANLISSRDYQAKLATATEAEGQKILKQLGIVW